MADQYSNFADLAAHERLGTDYRILVHDCGSMIAVIAPHGGRIEPGTSEIAGAVAGNDLSLYSFEGIRRGRAHGELHITSPRFDEPQALGLVAAVETAIAIHGRADTKDPAVWVPSPQMCWPACRHRPDEHLQPHCKRGRCAT